MNYIQETVKELKDRIAKAKGEIGILEKCVGLLEELVDEPAERYIPSEIVYPAAEPSNTAKRTSSGLTGVYPVGKNSKKWYASVTEKGKTKRLCGTYDTAEEAATARGEYLAKRDNEPGAAPIGKRTFGPSNDQPV